MSFIHGALIQKLTQQVDELYQRVVMLEGGKSSSKHTAKGGGLNATGEATEGSTESGGEVDKGVPIGTSEEAV